MKFSQSKLTRAIACGLLLSFTTGASLTSAVGASGGEATLKAVDIKADDRQYSWLDANTTTLSYDFTDTNILTYSRDENLANVSLRTNMIFDGQTLACKEGKTFSFGSAVFLGDHYGIRGGELAFDLNQTGGKLAVGLRLEKKAATDDRRGIWFTFDGSGQLTVTSPESELSAAIKGIPASGRVTFRDKVNTIEVFIGDKPIADVEYDAYNGAITVKDAGGAVAGSVESSTANAAGYFTLYADSMQGTIDNLSFTHTELTRKDTVTDAPAVDYSNWVAIDDRDRETPTNETTGNVREEKQVGVFYFVCQTGDASEEPCDNTYLYNKLGYNGMKDYLTNAKSNSYFWAEPYFGYYLNTDSWVQRKHAYMLEAAGVDFIFVDLSNGATYDQSLISLFDTWKAIRDEGGSTPDICLMGASSIGAVWNNVKGYIYSEEGVEKYGDLFYQYKGKPLIMADLSTVDEATRAEISERFTVRHTWAWSIGGSVWNWLQEYEVDENGQVKLSNGQWGHDGNGNHEELALCMGHHPTTSKGRSYVNGIVEYNKDYGFSMDSGAGLGFANSFRAVQKLDPEVMLITGWNEWIAGLTHDNQTTNFAGSKRNPFYFVDQFNTEYSRDGEPMKLRDGDGVGFGDNYYYQMASYIREFKGWEAAASASGQTSIDISKKDSWANVGPTFTDTANDTAWRSADGYFAGYTYVNNSGRNDLLTAKVSQDQKYLYFTVSTAEDVIISNDSDWMNLYLNIDGDSKNGWEGFDFVLNHARDGHYVSVESLAKGWHGEHVGQALYTVDGNTMTIRLDKAVIGVSGTATEILFKWADNATVDGHVMEFMDLGDTAPNDRYAFRYTCAEGDASATPSVAYKLIATDGSAVEARDESTLLPGVTNDRPGSDETETAADSGDGQETTDNKETSGDTAIDTTADTPASGESTPTSNEATADTSDKTEERGCASAVGGASLLLVATTAVWLRKKREPEK